MYKMFRDVNTEFKIFDREKVTFVGVLCVAKMMCF